MSADRGRLARRVALGLWLALLLSIVAWMRMESAPGPGPFLVSLLPLCAPLPGLVRGSRNTLRWASLTLAPVLAVALTEFLVNPAFRPAAGITLALLPVAFAALVAALRTTPPRAG